MKFIKGRIKRLELDGGYGIIESEDAVTIPFTFSKLHTPTVKTQKKVRLKVGLDVACQMKGGAVFSILDSKDAALLFKPKVA